MNSFDLYGYHLFNQWAGHQPILDKKTSWSEFIHYVLLL